MACSLKHPMLWLIAWVVAGLVVVAGVGADNEAGSLLMVTGADGLRDVARSLLRQSTEVEMFAIVLAIADSSRHIRTYERNGGDESLLKTLQAMDFRCCATRSAAVAG